jgi:tRNA(Ile)-lysidine synthase
MLQRFLDYIDRQHLFPPGKQVLLAVSGGRDSVCLAHLCHQARLPFAVAHCNFHLRPGDCDRDQQFVARLADGYGVPFHTVDFDTRAYAAAHGQSLEEAARELRYEYFAQLLTLNSQLSPVVATAHHRDDSIETFFLNLFRGTGISGLHGIRPVSELRIKNLELKIIRPLLPFSRAEIDAYIAGNNLDYVEDYTNAELDARRNQIRLRLLPLLRELYPSLDVTMAANIERLHDTELLYKEYISQLRSRLVKPYPSHLPGLPFEILSIDLPSLISLPSPAHSLLFELLRPYGFNGATVSDILAVVERGQIPGSNPSGQIFYSSTHVAEIHRGDLLVAPQTEPVPGRHPHPGDRVVKQPGNRSKGRLLSDYLKDLGLPRIERKHLLIGDFSHGDEPVGPVAGLTVVDKDGIRVGCLPVIAL